MQYLCELSLIGLGRKKRIVPYAVLLMQNLVSLFCFLWGYLIYSTQNTMGVYTKVKQKKKCLYS